MVKNSNKTLVDSSGPVCSHRFALWVTFHFYFLLLIHDYYGGFFCASFLCNFVSLPVLFLTECDFLSVFCPFFSFHFFIQTPLLVFCKWNQETWVIRWWVWLKFWSDHGTMEHQPCGNGGFPPSPETDSFTSWHCAHKEQQEENRTAERSTIKGRLTITS